MDAWWARVGTILVAGTTAVGLISSAAILHYRVGQLESDAVKQLEKRIDTTGERISTQWKVIADIKERVITLEAKDDE